MSRLRDDIPRSAYTQTVRIQTQNAVLSAAFSPQVKGDETRSTLLSRTVVFEDFEDMDGGECPLFNFAINAQGGIKKQPVRIMLDADSVIMINRVVFAVEDGTWVQIAAVQRYFEQKKSIDARYYVNENDASNIDPAYLRELDAAEVARQSGAGIENSITPLVMCKFTNDNWLGLAPGNDKFGATMVVSYQPFMKNGDPAMKPWTIEIQQYKLVCANGAETHTNEVSQSVRLKKNDMNNLLGRLILDLQLWRRDADVVALYKANPERYHSISNPKH